MNVKRTCKGVSAVFQRAKILQTVRKLPFVVTRGEAGQDEDDKISLVPDRQFCGQPDFAPRRPPAVSAGLVASGRQAVPQPITAAINSANPMMLSTRRRL
jgi:hypothetical protein